MKSACAVLQTLAAKQARKSNPEQQENSQLENSDLVSVWQSLASRNDEFSW